MRLEIGIGAKDKRGGTKGGGEWGAPGGGGGTNQFRGTGASRAVGTYQFGRTGASRAGVAILTLFQVGILGPTLDVTAGLLATVQETLVTLVPGTKFLIS
jgi:hypothetical protein